MLETVRWRAAGEEPLPGKVRLIDQTQLPETFTYIETDDLEEIFQSIRRLSVRGAPAIGCAAALGLTASLQHSKAAAPDAFLEEAKRNAAYLDSSRPTAVNLAWALRRCLKRLQQDADDGADVDALKLGLWEEAQGIVDEDIELCRQIGEHGVELFHEEMRVLTHCNAGALATSDYGTALSPMYVAQERGLRPKVFADETRPLLQGARLTTWELNRAGVDVTLICDNMAAQVMREGKIDLVITGADRIAANGDAANKIGTYGVAILARHHNIPFYIAAPYSTIDMEMPSGDNIPIEQRDPLEVSHGFGRQTAPDEVSVYNPAFDVTPNSFIAGIITERGILRPPFSESIRAFMAN